tara:strand:- start:2144 stop:2494 length:351 start_codon:yes stop_codon:yes gene_type:complete
MVKKMKDLFTDQELKDILSDLKPIEIPMGDDEIHREELYWTVGCIEIFADVICVRKTIHDSETYEEYGYMRTDDGTYEYLFEIDEMSIYCDNEECSTYKQRDNVVIPILNDLISIY